MQARRHGNHHHQMTVEVDWAHPPKRPTVNHKNSIALDPIRKDKERKTKSNVEAKQKDSRENPDDSEEIIKTEEKQRPGSARKEGKSKEKAKPIVTLNVLVELRWLK